MFIYHCAVNGQGAVEHLTDSITDLNVYSVFAPLDGWRWISSYLTVQDGITAQRLDSIGVKVPIDDRRL